MLHDTLPVTRLDKRLTPFVLSHPFPICTNVDGTLCLIL